MTRCYRMTSVLLSRCTIKTSRAKYPSRSPTLTNSMVYKIKTPFPQIKILAVHNVRKRKSASLVLTKNIPLKSSSIRLKSSLSSPKSITLTLSRMRKSAIGPSFWSVKPHLMIRVNISVPCSAITRPRKKKHRWQSKSLRS